MRPFVCEIYVNCWRAQGQHAMWFFWYIFWIAFADTVRTLPLPRYDVQVVRSASCVASQVALYLGILASHNVTAPLRTLLQQVADSLICDPYSPLHSLHRRVSP